MSRPNKSGKTTSTVATEIVTQVHRNLKCVATLRGISIRELTAEIINSAPLNVMIDTLRQKAERENDIDPDDDSDPVPA